jgi:hypothetical protein
MLDAQEALRISKENNTDFHDFIDWYESTEYTFRRLIGSFHAKIDGKDEIFRFYKRNFLSSWWNSKLTHSLSDSPWEDRSTYERLVTKSYKIYTGEWRSDYGILVNHPFEMDDTNFITSLSIVGSRSSIDTGHMYHIKIIDNTYNKIQIFILGESYTEFENSPMNRLIFTRK